MTECWCEYRTGHLQLQVKVECIGVEGTATVRDLRLKALVQPGIALLMLVSGATILTAAAPVLELSALRKQVVQFAGGSEALNEIETLSFMFVVRSNTMPPRRFQHTYSRTEGLYRYETSVEDFAAVPVWDETADDRWQIAPNPPEGDTLVAIYAFPRLDGTVYIDGQALSEPDNTRILRRVHSRVMNERAWLFLPLFMGSPRLHASLLQPVEDPRHGILHGFEGWWGEELGDSDVWTMYMDEEGDLVRTDFRLQHNLASSTTVYWRDWEWYGPVRIAHERWIPVAGRRLIFENVRVNEPVEIQLPEQSCADASSPLREGGGDILLR